MRTAEPTIFAIGDVAGEPMLAHKASHEGLVAARRHRRPSRRVRSATIPAVVFTDPEIAWCGLTEEAAKTSGQAVKVVRFPWAASGRATTVGRSDGLTKVVVDSESGRVLGDGRLRGRCGRADRRRRVGDRNGRRGRRPGRLDPSTSDAQRDGDGGGGIVRWTGHAHLSTETITACAHSTCST